MARFAPRARGWRWFASTPSAAGSRSWTGWRLVPDLGTDEIVIYAFDASAGSLGPARPHKTPAGSGPRLLLFSPDGRHAVLVEELGCRVVSFRWREGALEPVGACETTSIRP